MRKHLNQRRSSLRFQAHKNDIFASKTWLVSWLLRLMHSTIKFYSGPVLYNYRDQTGTGALSKGWLAKK